VEARKRYPVDKPFGRSFKPEHGSLTSLAAV